ncbi:unnamed protein product [Euphydryas editha]|uniref:Uncharacterized protein n=1 Tax=Euphydryas editha TaxID=104508 RepID=A0AAU9U3T5_EUPED|nr:unnamed protein product [Euphydryas editha]
MGNAFTQPATKAVGTGTRGQTPGLHVNPSRPNTGSLPALSDPTPAVGSPPDTPQELQGVRLNPGGPRTTRPPHRTDEQTRPLLPPNGGKISPSFLRAFSAPHPHRPHHRAEHTTTAPVLQASTPPWTHHPRFGCLTDDNHCCHLPCCPVATTSDS